MPDSPQQPAPYAAPSAPDAAQPAPYAAPSAPDAAQPAAFTAPSAPDAAQPSVYAAPSAPDPAQPAAFAAPTAPDAAQPAAFVSPMAPDAVQPAAYTGTGDTLAAATLTVDPPGANNTLVLTAATPGQAGNNISLTVDDTATLAGATAGASAALAGDDITLTLRAKWSMVLAGTLSYTTGFQGTVSMAGAYSGSGSVFLPMPDPPEWGNASLHKIGVRSNKWSIIGKTDLNGELIVAQQSSGVAGDYATPDLVPAWSAVGGATGTVTGITPGYPSAYQCAIALAVVSSKATVANPGVLGGSGLFATLPKTFFSGGTGKPAPAQPAPFVAPSPASPAHPNPPAT